MKNEDHITIKEALFLAIVPTLIGVIVVGLFLGIIAVAYANGALLVLIGLALFLGFGWIVGLGSLVWIDDRTHILDKLEKKYRKEKEE